MRLFALIGRKLNVILGDLTMCSNSAAYVCVIMHVKIMSVLYDFVIFLPPGIMQNVLLSIVADATFPVFQLAKEWLIFYTSFM